jgi:hypothetical protein
MDEQDRHLNDEQLSAKYGWAVQIVRRHFARGLEAISDGKFLDRRFAEFERKDDPIYAELLSGMEDRHLAKTFVSYWAIAQTLATRSRFWLEAAVADIIIHQVKHFGRPATEVYSHAMLRQGFPHWRRLISDMGEDELEHINGGSRWQAGIQQTALDAINVLVGKEEQAGEAERRQLIFRVWDQKDNSQARERDRAHMAEAARSLHGPPVGLTALQCNLLVIEPDRRDEAVHAWAIRFVNPKIIAQHAARKQERVNLLRLYALLVQEKIMRRPESISVCVAALVPRESTLDYPDHYADYFSAETYWSSNRLWEFIGVPFDVVRIAIHAAAKGFRDRLREGLRHLLPEESGPMQGRLFPS